MITENLSDLASVFEDSELSKDCMIYRCFIEKLLKVNFYGDGSVDYCNRAAKSMKVLNYAKIKG